MYYITNRWSGPDEKSKKGKGKTRLAKVGGAVLAMAAASLLALTGCPTSSDEIVPETDGSGSGSNGSGTEPTPPPTPTPEPVTLATPVVRLCLNRRFLSWNPVPNAFEYRIYVDGNEISVVDAGVTTIDLEALGKPVGTFSVSIRALSDPENDLKLDSAESNSMNFEIFPPRCYNCGWLLDDDGMCTNPDHVVSQPGPGNGNGNGNGPGNDNGNDNGNGCCTEPTPTDPVPLTAPVVSLDGTVISWDSVPNAVGFRIYVDGRKSGLLGANATSFDLATLGKPVGTFVVTLRALSDPTNEMKLDSAESNTINFEVLAPSCSDCGKELDDDGRCPDINCITNSLPVFEGCNVNLGGDGRDCVRLMKDFLSNGEVQFGDALPNGYTNWGQWVEERIHGLILETGRNVQRERIHETGVRPRGGSFPVTMTGLGSNPPINGIQNFDPYDFFQHRYFSIINFSPHSPIAGMSTAGTQNQNSFANPRTVASAAIIHEDTHFRNNPMHQLMCGSEFPCLPKEVVERAMEFYRIAWNNIFDNFVHGGFSNDTGYFVDGAGNPITRHQFGNDFKLHNIWDHLTEFVNSPRITNNMLNAPNTVVGFGLWANPDGIFRDPDGNVVDATPIPPERSSRHR